VLPVAVWLLLPALAKFNIVPDCGACETIPVPETVTAVPADTSTVWPAAVVNVAVPVPFTLTLTPHSSGRIPGWQGMMIISTTVCAIADADESINKPAKTKALVQPCLFTGKLSYTRTTAPKSNLTNYPRIPSVPYGVLI
jgi:hypothetical protein